MIFGGKDDCYQLFIHYTDKNKNGDKIISPPQDFDLSTTGFPYTNTDIKKICLGNDHSVILFKDGTAIAFGDDTKFHIGTQNRQIYKKAHQISFSSSHNLFDNIFCGDDYTIYLTIDGALIYCNDECKKKSKKKSSKSDPVYKEKLISLECRPVYISGSWEAPVAIDNNGDFYIFDSNPKVAPQKVHLQSNEKVVDICRCDSEDYQFIAVVTENGNVYGNGLLNHNKFDEFALVESLQGHKISRIFGYSRHCLALSDDGKLFGVGLNWHGQLGTDRVPETSSFVEIEMPENKKVVDVCVGNLHSAVATADGSLYTFGSNFYGQLLKEHSGDEEFKHPQNVLQQFGQRRATNVFAGAFSTVVLYDVPNTRINLKESFSHAAENNEIYTLKCKIAEQDLIIEDLRKKLKEKDEEIKRLKQGK